MLTIKLSRTGKKNRPNFRLIVLEKQRDPWGDFLENLGNYDPRTKQLSVNADRVKYWLGKGAKTTKSVHNLFVNNKLIDAKKVRVTHLNAKKRAKIEEKAKKEKETVAPAGATEPTATPAQNG